MVILSHTPKVHGLGRPTQTWHHGLQKGHIQTPPYVLSLGRPTQTLRDSRQIIRDICKYDKKESNWKDTEVIVWSSSVANTNLLLQL